MVRRLKEDIREVQGGFPKSDPGRLARPVKEFGS
jgi:hypothetical protein